MNLQKVDLTTPQQKIIAGVSLAVVVGVIWFLLPSLIWFFENLIWLGVLAVITIFAVWNYNNIWNYMKQLTWQITKNRIASDMLYYMYKYHEYLLGRLSKLNDNIVNVSAIVSKSERKLQDTLVRHKQNKDLAIAYKDQGKSELIVKTAYSKVQIDQELIDSLQPKVESAKKQEKYLKDLYDAWAFDIEQLKYKLDNKAEEYTLLKEMAEATGNASEFLKGNSTEYKEFQESLTQIEDSVNHFIGTIDSFERKVSPIMEGLASNQALTEEAGRKLVEEYKKERVDFSK